MSTNWLDVENPKLRCMKATFKVLSARGEETPGTKVHVCNLWAPLSLVA